MTKLRCWKEVNSHIKPDDALIADKTCALAMLYKEAKGYENLLIEHQDKKILDRYVSEKIVQVAEAKSKEQLNQINQSCKIKISRGKAVYTFNKYCTQAERYLAIMFVSQIIGSDPITERAITTLKQMAVSSFDRKAV